jgi:cyclophilin family peptidyl-prolyl cis-trans isomerase
VDNFVNYITSGRYADTIFHRVTRITTNPDTNDGIAVLQGGGFEFSENPSALTEVDTDAPIPLQAILTNTRGTIAMARTGQPDSATSQFFLNTADNKALDTSGGGFAVFGAVRSGQDVIDQAYATPEQDRADGSPENAAFGEIPLNNFPTSDPDFPEDTTRANYEIVNTAAVVRQPQAGNTDFLTFTANSSNTSLVATTIVNGVLRLTYAPGQTGQATITLTATDANGRAVTEEFVVTVG